MPPVPNREHQDFQWALKAWLRAHWARPHGNKVHHEINLAPVGGWPNEYRILDLALLTPDRFEIDHNEYFEGPPTVVVEIRSPGDETAEKMPFYAKLGVPEVWVIDRDTKTPELYSLKSGRYEKQPLDDAGWVPSAATGVRLRAESGQKLAVRMAEQRNRLQGGDWLIFRAVSARKSCLSPCAPGGQSPFRGHAADDRRRLGPCR